MKKATLKSTLCILLSVMTFCATSVSAYAEPGTNIEQEISPQYVELSVVQARLSIDEGGTATCKSEVTTRHAEITVKIQMELQQKQSSGWKTIKTWNKTDTSPCSLEKEYALKKGYDYQVYATVNVYDENGNKIEQGAGYSKIVHY